MLADIGNLVGLLIFAVIAILSAVLKKKQKDQEDTFDLPPELRPPRPRESLPPARNWEEELRHLLEERRSPPPIVRHVPPPVMQPEETTWAEPPVEVPHHAPARSFETVAAVTAEQQEAALRFAEATHLHQRVAHQHLPHRHHAGTTSVRRTRPSDEITQVTEIFRTRRGARAAIIASIILGPPRALEKSPY